MKKFALILAFVLPLIFFGLVFGLQNYFNSIADPQYDYIYVTGDNNCIFNYDIEFDKITVVDEYAKTNKDCAEADIEIYIHDVRNNRSNKISLDQAKQYKLSRFYLSPDKYEFRESYSSGLGFTPSYSEGYVLNGNKATLKQDLVIKSNVKFIGWVV